MILGILINSAQGAILDQVQEEGGDCWLVICGDWSIAQTFTAGITGQLQKVDLYLENTFTYPDPSNATLHPINVSIVHVVDSAPSGSVLGEVYVEDSQEGFNSIEFLLESVFLSAGNQYGIVVTNDDIERYDNHSTQWTATLSDVYSAGALWSYTSETGWVQEVQPPDPTLPVETFYDKDAAFRTWMVPEPGALLFLGLGGLVTRRLYKQCGNS
jgi:hypothetical protein